MTNEEIADRAARELVLDCCLHENFESAAARIVARAIEESRQWIPGEMKMQWQSVERAGKYGWEGIDCPRCGHPIRITTGGGGKGHSHPMLLSHVETGSTQCPSGVKELDENA